ncbi:MAG TPA: hypothetical protein VN408_08385, partial [Actinoplanes sp.]|nr:hypothetical protein [Actinoplanes sp.]
MILGWLTIRCAGWQRWAWPFRGAGVAFIILLFAFVTAPATLTGLFERLLAALALGITRTQLVPELTALENVALPLRLDGVRRKSAEQRAAALLERLHLSDKAKARP